MQPMKTKRAGTALARAIELAGTAVTLVLLAGIALVLLKANNGNDIVHAVRSAADFLAGPFNGMFELDNPRTSIAINWGIAAAVYYAATRVIAGFISRRV
jgi:lysylphosphatidylglycerol synthetase-like protein (DUF2156 family)